MIDGTVPPSSPRGATPSEEQLTRDRPLVMEFRAVDANANFDNVDINAIYDELLRTAPVGLCGITFTGSYRNIVIRVCNSDYVEELSALTVIAGREVTMMDSRSSPRPPPPRPMRCMITGVDRSLSDSTMLQSLAAQGVIEVHRVKYTDGDQQKTTSKVILLFEGSIPRSVLLSCSSHEVIHLVEPKNCFKCFSYSHMGPDCDKAAQICFRCSSPGHIASGCIATLRCTNCCGPHRPWDGRCPVRKAAIKSAQELAASQMLKSRTAEQIPRNPPVILRDTAITLTPCPSYAFAVMNGIMIPLGNKAQNQASKSPHTSAKSVEDLHSDISTQGPSVSMHVPACEDTPDNPSLCPPQPPAHPCSDLQKTVDNAVNAALARVLEPAIRGVMAESLSRMIDSAVERSVASSVTRAVEQAIAPFMAMFALTGRPAGGITSQGAPSAQQLSQQTDQNDQVLRDGSNVTTPPPPKHK
jgi:hypothetical protein